METEVLSCCNLCGSVKVKTEDEEHRICRCEVCGYVFDSPRPTARAISDFYSKPTKYDRWLDQEMARDALWIRRLESMARTRRNGSLLDVGTGIGQFLRHARSYYSQVEGTEVSESAIRIAREKYNLSIIKGDIEKLDFGGRQFDNITVFHVLEHVPNPRALIEKCRSLLADDGVMVVAVPNELWASRSRVGGLLRKLGLKEQRDTGKWGLPRLTLDGSLDEIHVSHFTPRVLQRFLEASGFSVIENSLDPYYVAVGPAKVKEALYYAFCRLVRFLTGINIYDTIWVVARKRAHHGA